MKIVVEPAKNGWKVVVEVQSDIDKRHIALVSGAGKSPQEAAWWAAHHVRRILDDALMQLASFGCAAPSTDTEK